MVNPVEHLQTMKDRIGGDDTPLGLPRRPQTAQLIRPDGSLAPCFDLIDYDHDWGRIWEPRFVEEEALRSNKRNGSSLIVPRPASHTMGTYYDLRALPQMGRETRHDGLKPLPSQLGPACAGCVCSLVKPIYKRQQS